MKAAQGMGLGVALALATALAGYWLGTQRGDVSARGAAPAAAGVQRSRPAPWRKTSPPTPPALSASPASVWITASPRDTILGGAGWVWRRHWPHPRLPRILAGGMNHMAAVEEDGGLEQAVGDEMKDGEGKGAQAAFHDHVAHLPDGRKAQRFLDVVLSQHHGGAEDGRQHADDEDHV